MPSDNPFNASATLSTSSGDVTYYRLRQLADDGLGDIDTLPYSIRILLEACLRNVDGFIVTEEDVTALAGWSADVVDPAEIPFKPGRVVCRTSPVSPPSSISLHSVRRWSA
ncbi:MAG: hypothetical protein CM1200mP2_53620 [Planctomycetaceae bacterium]|nr:MAG: hypothetical protein CM1200mP2_53620 [Planctomycetaceae bacterium]